MNTLDALSLRVTIVAATGLYNKDHFSHPSPFAIATIDSVETFRTCVVVKTLTPCWNKSFIAKVTTKSHLTIRIFDLEKLQKKGEGFLEVVNIPIETVINPGVSVNSTITRDLKTSKSGRLVVHGKITLDLSTNLPPHAHGPARLSGSNPSPLSKRSVETTSAIYPAELPRDIRTSQHRTIAQASITPGNTSTASLTSSINEGRLSSRSTTSEDAVWAWNRRFAEPQVHLERNDPAPFHTTRELGGGG